MDLRVLNLFAACLLVFASCANETKADQTTFEASLTTCSPYTYVTEIPGFAGVEYQIYGIEDGLCVIDMRYLSNPNPAWVEVPLTVQLAPPLSPAFFQEAMAACLEGKMPHIADGTCSGPLLEVLGHSTSQSAAVSLATGPFSQAGCGKAYSGAAPTLYRMHAPSVDRWGYLNEAGTWAIAPQFTQARDFSEGLAAVLNDGVWQVIDTSGGVVMANIGAASTMSYQRWETRNIYTSPIKGFSEGCARFTKDDGTRFYLSRDGELWLDTPTPAMAAAAEAVGGQVRDIHDFKAGLARFEIDVETFGQPDPVGYINGAGEVAIPAIYARAKDFDPDSGLAPAGLVRDKPSPFPKGWIYINQRGEKVLPKDDSLYKSPEEFSGGFAVIGEGFSDFYWDAQGTKQPFGPFASAHAFSEGMALVRPKGGDYGWINSAGEMVFTEKDIGLCSSDFAKLQHYQNGLILLVISKDGGPCGEGRSVNIGGGAESYVNGEFAYIDTKGQVKWRASEFAE